MQVRIFMLNKSAMQSGRAKVGRWQIAPTLPTPRRRDGLTGWVSSGDTLASLNMKFDTFEGAQRFALKQGWKIMMQTPEERIVTPRNYIQNIKPLLTSDK